MSLLQWGDELTANFLNEALREQASLPLFVLSFARPEVHQTFPKLWQGHRAQELQLKGLGKKACERLIQQVLGKHVLPEAIALAIDHAAGNALFLEELIRSLAEGTVSAQPETVLAMLQARIGHLDASVRRTVRAASVFGQTFWQGGIAAILGFSKADPNIEVWLAALADAELIQVHSISRLANEKEYSFRHALVRDAAYSLLTSSDLSTGHRLAGDFLEAAGEHDAAIIAEHFERSGERSRAASFYLQAAEDMLARGNLYGALRHAGQGVVCGAEGKILGQLRSIESFISVSLDQYDRVEEGSGVALAQLKAGSLGFCRAMFPAIMAAINRQDAPRVRELVSMLLSTEPDADARVAYIDALSYTHLIFSVAAPAFLLQAILHKLATYVGQLELANPTIRRHLCLSLAFMALFREPGPWTLVKECQRVLTLADLAGNSRESLMVSGTTIEWGWLDLGDIEGARQRMSALEATMGQSQDIAVVSLWRHLFARALCASGDETAWTQAEQIVAPMLSYTGVSFYFRSWLRECWRVCHSYAASYRKRKLWLVQQCNFFRFCLPGCLI